MKISDISYGIFASAAVFCLMTGCSDDLYDTDYKPSLENHYLSVYPRDFEFKSGEDSKMGEISSHNEWSFRGVPVWLSVSPQSGKTYTEFEVKSSSNNQVSNRTAVFYVSENVSAGGMQRTLTATQASASPFLTITELDKDHLYYNGSAQSAVYDVETNLNDLTTQVGAGKDWITASYQDKQLKLLIKENESSDERSGDVKLYSSDYSVSKTIYITQYKAHLSLNEFTSLTYDADGGGQSVKISSEVPWKASTQDSWIEVSPTQGTAGESQITITSLPSYQTDTRNGRVSFWYGNGSSTGNYISVTQSGRFINVSTSSLLLSAEENSSGIINIDSNIGWEVVECPEWITSSVERGNPGKTEVSLVAQKNNALNSRYGSFTIADDHMTGIKRKLTIHQKGFEFDENTSFEFNWHQSSVEFDIPFSSSWNAVVSDGWISLSDYTGSGETKIVVSVSKNENADSRMGKIQFTSEGKTVEARVVQAGQYLKIDNTSGEFTALGGSTSLTVDSSISTSWRVDYLTPNEEWVHIDEKSNGEYAINVDYNPSCKNRIATFKLIPDDSDVSESNATGVAFGIKQSGRSISSDASKICVVANGGTSQTYHISADGKYTITKDSADNWYTLVLNQESNTFYVVVTDNSTGSNRVGHLTLSLADLPTGETLTKEIEIFQYKSGINISFDDFEQDVNW